MNKKPARLLKRCKIGPRLLWRTNAFDWYQNQWPWTVEKHSCGKTRLTEPTGKSWMNIDPNFLEICLNEYSQGFPREEAPNDSGVLEILDVQTYPSKFLTLKPTHYTAIHSPSSAFQWSQNAWPWMTSKRDSRCLVLVGARCVCVDKVAVFSVHKRSIIDLL